MDISRMGRLWPVVDLYTIYGIDLENHMVGYGGRTIWLTLKEDDAVGKGCGKTRKDEVGARPHLILPGFPKPFTYCVIFLQGQPYGSSTMVNNMVFKVNSVYGFKVKYVVPGQGQPLTKVAPFY